MFLAYLESVKYVGHLWPLALVRIVIGYHSLSLAVQRWQAGYLENAYISEKLNLSEAMVSGFYFDLVKSVVQSQWLAATYMLIFAESLIGISYILGFGVRVTSLLGLVVASHLYLFFEFASSPGQVYLIYIHLLFCLLGAGRCLGLDYYFYKSRRGLLW